jgi:hypothetical protein
MTNEEQFLELVAVAVRARRAAPEGFLDVAKRTAARIPKHSPAAGVFIRWLYKEGLQADRWILEKLRPDKQEPPCPACAQVEPCGFPGKTGSKIFSGSRRGNSSTTTSSCSPAGETGKPISELRKFDTGLSEPVP